MTPREPTATLRALVTGLIDYAGLFPPAELPMDEAVAAYASYRASPEAWMLGRFVVPVSRLLELGAHAGRYLAADGTPWHLAALAGADVLADAVALRAFNTAHGGRLVADVLETRVADADELRRIAGAASGTATLYVELPIARDPRELLEATRDAGARAKVRTGGVTAEAFPSADDLARFIVRAAELGVAFKATAGLHHPLRAEHRLTYALHAPTGTMFGFLNVFAAAAFARAGMPQADLVRLLEERDADALGFDGDELRWQGHGLDARHLAAVRRDFAMSFGSCSFQEPVDDLHQLGLL